MIDVEQVDPLDGMRAALQDADDADLARLVELNRGADPASSRLIRNTWHTLLQDQRLAPHMLAAIERSGALTGALDPRPRLLVEDLLSALGRWHHEPARPLLQQLWAGQGELAMRAGHALLAFGDRDALATIAASLDEVTSGELFLALQAVFTLAPALAWDELAPRFAQPSPRAGVVLDATLNLFMRDICDDGKAHWGPTRGWFGADPRWLELCDRWRKLPPPALRPQWGAKQAQRIVECAAWLRKRASAT